MIFCTGECSFQKQSEHFSLFIEKLISRFSNKLKLYCIRMVDPNEKVLFEKVLFEKVLFEKVLRLKLLDLKESKSFFFLNVSNVFFFYFE